MIEVKNLTKRFKRVLALDDISLDLHKGQVVSLIGPNGSGKTTLIKSILGLVKPDSGEIKVNGTLLKGQYNYRSTIGYMPQIGRYPDHMRVAQLFDLLDELRGQPEHERDIDLIEFFKLRGSFDKAMRTLSGGTRQKVSAAVAFLFKPAIYILDEPTAGLDPLASEILKEKIKSIKEENKLVLITSHILSDLDELTNHVLYLQEGRIHFNDSMDKLQDYTGELKFGKAIAKLMQKNGAA